MRSQDPKGNERLTSSTGLVLLVLLAVETLTTIALRTYLNVHVFLGLLLLPPVALKLASTGWRFARYCMRNESYVSEGTVDWRRNTDGAHARRALLVGTLLAGVVLAAATLPQQRAVLHHGGHRHHHDDG